MICIARFFWTFMRHHKWFRLKFNHLNFDGSFEVVVVQPFEGFLLKSCPSNASTLKAGLFLGIASNNKILLARSRGCNQWQYMFIRKRLLHFPDKVKAATYFCYFGTLQAKCGEYAFSSHIGAPHSDFRQALFTGRYFTVVSNSVLFRGTT